MSLRTGACAVAFIIVACNPAQGALPDDGTSGVETTGNTMFPCEVGQVLQSKCWECHGSPTQFSAPMSLLTWESVQQPTRDGTEKIFQRIGTRIHDSANPMPPPLYPRLSSEEIAVLDNWIAGGAQSGTGCQTQNVGTGGGTGNTGGTNGTGSTPNYGGSGSSSSGGSGNGGTGGIDGPEPYPDAGGPDWSPEDIPVEPTADECDYIDIVARQDANGGKYNVPGGEQYYCFGYHIEAEAGAQGLAFYPIIDNTQVIHHWLLYKTVTAQTNGTVNQCLGLHIDGELMAGWAPGAQPAFLPAHVGQELGTGDFVLEVHYNNTVGAAQDGSGVRVCKAKNHRPETASVSWLGTDTLFIPAGAQNWEQGSNCTPNITEPIHILKSWPHMHLLGVHMTTKIHRADGTEEALVDVPFDFNSQIPYNTPKILNTGDWLSTQCFYDNPTGAAVVFGEFTNQEMCYNFVTAYPARALVSGGIHTTSCNNF